MPTGYMVAAIRAGLGEQDRKKRDENKCVTSAS